MSDTGWCPDEEECMDLLISAGCSARVIGHCRSVTVLAYDMAVRSGVTDPKQVLTGAMLHDIGRGFSHSLHHAQMGADYCRRKGITEEIARIVECHTGAGLTPDECTLLGLSPRDCLPSTLGEKIVAHADNLVKGTKTISLETRIMKAYHLPGRVRERMYRLALEVETACGR